MERTNEILDIYEDNTIYSKDNSVLFIEYLKSNGIDINNYKKILELYSRPKESITRLLDRNQSFLLSEQVTKKELDKYNIAGAYGSLTIRGITTPRCIINDQIYLQNGKDYKNNNGGYQHHKVTIHDLIISNGVPDNTKGIIKFLDKNILIGICRDINDKGLEEQIKLLKKLKEELIKNSTNEYIIKEDNINTANKKIYLLLKK